MFFNIILLSKQEEVMGQMHPEEERNRNKDKAKQV